jgi:hypothetical protein
MCFMTQIVFNANGIFILLMFAAESDVQWFLEESLSFLLLL